MTKKKERLGKGLDAIFQPYQQEKPKEAVLKVEGNILEINLRDIDPNHEQPRKNFDKETLQNLADSISEFGVIEPIVVKKKDDRYLIVAGERRWRASMMLGNKTIPAVIKDYTDKEIQIISLVENILREDLDPIEEALALRGLIEKHNVTQEELSKTLGKSRSAITNTLRLLGLPDSVKTMLAAGEISQGHARALLGADDEQTMIDCAKLIVEKGLSVRETEKLIKDGNSKKPKKIKKAKSNLIIDLEEQMQNSLGTKVSISEGKKSSKIEIEYYSNDDLQRILDKLL